jgi:hypothetical protein
MICGAGTDAHRKSIPITKVAVSTKCVKARKPDATKMTLDSLIAIASLIQLRIV